MNRLKDRFFYLMALAIYIIRSEGISVFLTKLKRRLLPGKASLRAYTLQTELRAFALPFSPSPKVSLVIPVFNKSLFTFNCLLSIAEQSDAPSYEVIVVDNASSDDTPRVLAMVEHVRVVRNEKNLGFVDACNAGAAAALGEYLLFLNNDTMVTPGWLSALVRTFEENPLCGAAGSKLIYPDGTLQEAGGIIWKDASGWNYGKFDDPDKPEYNYVREVDYCSGAALMVRKKLFDELGGFDLRFAPAYWEDADLCFSLRKLGYKVLYQPASVVVHFEGISAGTSTASGMKRFQDINTSKFTEKWSEELSRQQANDPSNVFPARDRNAGKRILVVDHYVPRYDKDAGSFFMFSLLRSLVALGYRIVFWPDSLQQEEPYTTTLQQMGVEVVYGKNNFSKYLRRYGKFFDAAILTRNHIAIHFIDDVRKHIPKIIYHDPDLEFLREQRRLALEGGSQKKLTRIKEREFYLFRNCDIIGIHSPFEKDIILAEMAGASVEVIPLSISETPLSETPFASRSSLLFIGGTHPPNADALFYFIRDILPLVSKQIPEIQLTVVGEVHKKKLQDLSLRNIVFTGFVNDLLPYFEQARVFVAPLRYGAGIKGKILEAMSFGVPVVTTQIGAEGIGLTNGKEAIIADGETAFADAVVRLYREEPLWTRLRSNGQRYVQTNFSQELFNKKVEEVMRRLFHAAY